MQLLRGIEKKLAVFGIAALLFRIFRLVCSVLHDDQDDHPGVFYRYERGRIYGRRDSADGDSSGFYRDIHNNNDCRMVEIRHAFQFSRVFPFRVRAGLP